MIVLAQDAFARTRVAQTERDVMAALAKGERDIDMAAIVPTSAAVALILAIRRQAHDVRLHHVPEQIMTLAQLYGVQGFIQPLIQA